MINLSKKEDVNGMQEFIKENSAIINALKRMIVRYEGYDNGELSSFLTLALGSMLKAQKVLIREVLDSYTMDLETAYLYIVDGIEYSDTAYLILEQKEMFLELCGLLKEIVRIINKLKF